MRVPPVAERAESDLAPQEIRWRAAEAVVAGVPLVLMDLIRRSHPMTMTRFLVLSDDCGALAPGLLDEDVRTIRSSAWISLADGPVVLHVPSMHGRHLIISLFDAWGDQIGGAGLRKQRQEGFDIALVGPRWRGELAGHLLAVRARTDAIWALSRITGHGAADRETVRELAARQYLVPLTAASRMDPGDAHVRLESPASPCLDQLQSMRPEVFFHRLDVLLRRHPPPRAEQAYFESMPMLQGEGLSPPVREAVAYGLAEGLARIQAAAEAAAASRIPWRAVTARGENRESDILQRAVRAFRSLGLPASEDLMKLVCEQDETDRRLIGAERYRLHFGPHEAPPVEGFWSLSLGGHTRMSELMLHRYALCSRDRLAFNRDGSLDLYIQHQPPAADLAPNWLPAPPGDFSLSMWLYGASRSALDGGWRMPSVERLGSRTLQGSLEAGR